MKRLIVIIVILAGVGAAGYWGVWPRLHPAGEMNSARADGNDPLAEKAQQAARAWADGNVQSAEKTELRKLFDGAVKSLDVSRPDPDQAIQQILQGVRKDPSNGYWYYLIAAAHMQKGQTSQAAKDVRKGNQQAACYLYVTEKTASEVYHIPRPHLSMLRQLIRDLVAQAPQLGTEAGAEALQAAWTMGGKTAREEPKLLINVLISEVVRAIASRGLAQLYEQAGLSQQAHAARDLEAKNKQWLESVRTIGREYSAWGNVECRKLGINILQLDNPPPELKEKVENLVTQKLQKERAAVEQALKTMPP